MPDAEIFSFDNGTIHPCQYEDTDSYVITKTDELRERATAATERYHAMGDSIKAAETRLAEIAVPRFASWYPPSIWKAI